MNHILAIVVDYKSTEEARHLTLQLPKSELPAGCRLTVVHVDNGNPQKIQLNEEQKKLGVRMLRLPQNGGYAAGLIGAIEYFNKKDSSIDGYWFLNSDLEVEPNTLRILLERIESDPLIGAIGPQVFYNRGPKIWGGRGIVSPVLGVTAMKPWFEARELPRWSYIPGSSLLIRRKAYESVNGLSLRYKMYYEETELCIKLQKANWKLWVEKDSKAYHMVKSMESGIPSPTYAFYFSRNNLYFWNHNFGIPWFVQAPRLLFVVAKELVLPLRKAKSSKDFWGRLRLVIAGLLDAREFLSDLSTQREKKLFPDLSGFVFSTGQEE